MSSRWNSRIWSRLSRHSLLRVEECCSLVRAAQEAGSRAAVRALLVVERGAGHDGWMWFFAPVRRSARARPGCRAPLRLLLLLVMRNLPESAEAGGSRTTTLRCLSRHRFLYRILYRSEPTSSHRNAARTPVPDGPLRSLVQGRITIAVELARSLGGRCVRGRTVHVRHVDEDSGN
jgi:hypothetical protein